MRIESLNNAHISTEKKNDQTTTTPCIPVTSIRNTAAVRIQSFFKGVNSRKSLSIKRLEKGVIKVEINSHEIISKLINKTTDSAHPVKNKIIYFAIDQEVFKGKISQTSSDYLNITTKNDIHSKNNASQSIKSIMINGGYYNYKNRASKDHNELTPIGKMNAENIDFEHLPIPEKYIDNYIEIRFPDGSLIESAPILTKKGTPVLLDEKDPRYSLDEDFSFDKQFIIPGEIRHAADRNPRAAISLPESRNDGTVRIVACISQERGVGGLTLTEWSNFLSKIDKMSTPHSSSINLDGGGSVRIILIMSDGKNIVYSQNKNMNAIANHIEFVKNTA